MIEIQIPENNNMGVWIEPENEDYKWMSLWAYMQCQFLEALRLGGYTIKQIQETDAQTMIDDANTQIAQTLADITDIYGD